MKFETTGIEHEVIDLVLLTEIMEKFGFVCAGGWDYERITFDYKFELLNDVFYLRVQGYAIEGDIGARRAKIKLLAPIIGKHYYPHGIEYGEDEHFPEQILAKSKQLLKEMGDSFQNLPNISHS